MNKPTNAELALEVERLQRELERRRKGLVRVLSDAADRGLRIEAEEDNRDVVYPRLAGLYESTLYAVALEIGFERRDVFLARYVRDE